MRQRDRDRLRQTERVREQYHHHHQCASLESFKLQFWFACRTILFLLCSLFKMATGGYRLCKPVPWHADVCVHSRVGEAIKVYRRCEYCSEYRCKSHCLCARRNRLRGRNQGRPGPYAQAAVANAAPKAAAAAKAGPKAAAACKAAPKPAAAAKAAPIDHTRAAVDAAPKIFSLMCQQNWIDDLVCNLPRASEMVLCSFAYDDRELHNSLLARVSSGELRLKLVVDGRYLYGKNAPCFSLGRLQALAQAGADIRTAGSSTSNMHYKIAVLSGQDPPGYWACYHCGSNATQSSRSGWECTVRHMQPDVVEQFRAIAEHCFSQARALMQ